MLTASTLDATQFDFLFETRSPEHVYYRWKLFSVLQVGWWRQEQQRDWRKSFLEQGGKVND
jgi:hypothetical protein